MGGKGKRSKDNQKKRPVNHHRQHKMQQRDMGFEQQDSLPTNEELSGMLKDQLINYCLFILNSAR